ncbi:dihydropteroate synthase [Candidozyma duobushaemuli]|uniref:Dihydropteroate synthase n=1 Tax=Candidozyma duobushaemuli TaxID=1231522 RepID=A0A2V1ACX2_9ASCO|nr:dihydropteroate synthase [[Candida] duobushaemulonis]PVH15572.1 dihydropteroate synthase [[Candida] duobushaemulonis]
MDKVYVSGLQAQAIVGVDHWKRPVPHPVSVDAVFSTDFVKASERDNLTFSLNYAVISEKLLKYADLHRQRNFGSLGGLGRALYGSLHEERSKCSGIEVSVSAPKLDIRAPVSFVTDGSREVYKIHGLRALTLIGVFTFERENRQFVDLDIEMEANGDLHVPAVSASVYEYLEQANFKTVEALVKRTSQWICQQFNVETVHVRVTKPNAIVYTDGVGVSTQCERADFANEEPISFALASKTGFDLPVEEKPISPRQTAYIAFGSNEGNQLENIKDALDLLSRQPGIHVQSTSSLYVSKPMYHTDQADFYNGVVRVVCENMAPHDLLKTLKKIEYEHLQRRKEFDNGPRTIDLDIVFFGDSTINTPDLVVPHKSMLERTFVLQPLCELVPPDFIHPVTAEPVHDHLRRLLATVPDPSVQESSELLSVVPGSGKRHLTFSHNSKKPTLIMGIFNATPDSFSDGGKHFELSKQDIVEAALKQKAEGATIIDIGGVSTRPGSSEPSVEEELTRVVPVVEAIRAAPELDDIFVSVDTYRAAVAEAVLQAGADIINDISMGTLDPDLFSVIAKYGCAYVMSHTRGTPKTMSKLTEYGPSDDSLVEYQIDSHHGIQAPAAEPVVNGVCRELAAQLIVAMDHGVKKWQVIIDPGIGFAKNISQNLTLLRRAKTLKQYAQNDLNSGVYTSFHGLALLVGTSRKGFLGTISGKEASDRMIPTAATVVACVQQNTDIVRVHDVADIQQAVKTADAVYKGIF